MTWSMFFYPYAAHYSGKENWISTTDYFPVRADYDSLSIGIPVSSCSARQPACVQRGYTASASSGKWRKVYDFEASQGVC